MKKFIVGLVTAALLPLSVSVQAKTFCFSAFGGNDHIKFVGVTALKKPGSVSLIKGMWREGSAIAPITGSAMTLADGTVTLGFTYQAMATAMGRDFSFAATGLDQTLAGTYSFDNTGDGIPDSSTPLTPISCKDFSLTPVI